eukprot:4203364-Pleurochrysis_carterae.AAC.8
MDDKWILTRFILTTDHWQTSRSFQNIQMRLNARGHTKHALANWFMSGTCPRVSCNQSFTDRQCGTATGRG